MAANAVDFAGTLCGCRYEKELETHFRDCLLSVSYTHLTLPTT